jgi:hypothetical protein
MDLVVPLLIGCQAIGALIGACTVIWGELTYIRAIRDGHVDDAERNHLIVIGHGLRYGMTLLLLGSAGTVYMAYALESFPPALTASYWVFMLVALTTTIASWALARRHVSSLLGSATIFTAWWFLVYMALGLLPALSIGSAIALFVVFAGIFYALLRYMRFRASVTMNNL